MADEITEGAEPLVGVGDAHKALAESGFFDTGEYTGEGAPEAAAESVEGAAVADETEPQQAAPATTPVAPPAATDDPFSAYGGKDEVEAALAVAQGLRTESGVRLMVAQGLAALGKDPEQVRLFMEGKLTAAQEAALVQEAAAPADPLAEISDDDVVTGAELKAFVQRAAEQAAAQALEAVKPIQDQVQHDRDARQRQVVDSTLVELLGENGDPATIDTTRAQDVLDGALKYLDEGTFYDPTAIRNALVRANADVEARDEARYQAYLNRKKVVADQLPPIVGGGTPPGGEEVPEPQNMAEARERLKREGFFNLT
jgi:hypothetical protein